MSDPYDPIEAAMRNLNNANLLAAKDARIRQLEADVERMTEEIQVYKEGVMKSDNLFKSIGIFVKDEEWVADGITQLIEQLNNTKAKSDSMLYAGNELARVLDDIAQVGQLDAIAKAVVIATIAKWNRAKTGQL